MYVFLAVDVDGQFLDVKDKASVIDKVFKFKDPCFALPLHISLKTSFKIDDASFENVVKEVTNYYLSIQPFKINVHRLELYDNIVWVRAHRNKRLDKAHDNLNSILLERYNVRLHEYDLDYKYHVTLFMDSDTDKIKNAYNLVNRITLPHNIMANQFIIGVSETGELGSYSIHRRIRRRT